MATFVLVHGMAHGGWCWDPVVERLTAAGHDVHAPDLPLTGLGEDADAIGALLDEIATGAQPDGKTVLVGHSYGGQVISRAAAGRGDVDHLVYVAAVMVGADETPATRSGEHPPAAGLSQAVSFADGWLEITGVAGATAAFYNCCDPAVAAAAAERLRRTHASCLSTPSGAEPWADVASTYVLCKQDGAIHPEFQRSMSSAADVVVEIDTDHSPFLSTPDRLTEILLAAAPTGSSAGTLA